MTALAGDRNAFRFGTSPIPSELPWPQKSATTLYQGAIVVANAGYAAPGTTATGLIALGVSPKQQVNSGADGAKTAVIQQGVFPFENSAAGDLIAQADAGADCFIVDDQTVAKTNGTNTRSRAGKIVGIENGKVLVLVGIAV